MSSRTRERPNVLFIITDQQRRDSLGCYGNPVAQTPNLDRLSSEGVTFDNAFSANVICMPSRATLLTGRYPRTHGVITNGVALSEDEITLGHCLTQAGYTTAAVGKTHLTPHGGDGHEFPPGSGRTYVGPEMRAWHAAGKDYPLPYYGFQHLATHQNHPGDGTHHRAELVAVDPKLPELWERENALEPPTGAPSSWKSAMPEEHSSSQWVADKTMAFVDRFAEEGNPFFIQVGFPDPHFPYCPVAPWCHMYDPADVPPPNRTQEEVALKSDHYRRRLARFEQALGYHPTDMPEAYLREIIAHTYGMVSQIDHNVGRIVAHLEARGLAENTVVVFLTDHGEHLGDHHLIYKAIVYDELYHMPMIFWGPGRLAGGRRVDALTSYVDFMPTILDLAGVDAPRGVQGRSFRAALADEEFAGREAVFLEDDEEDNRSFCRTLRTARYQMTVYLPTREGELYDVQEDPAQQRNLWNDAGYARVKADLFEQMAFEMMLACDPKPERVAST